MAKRKDGKIELIMSQGTKMVEYYRQHPCQAAYDLLGVDLAPVQRLMFRDMWFKNFVVAVCSRGSGKTFLLGTIAALSCLLYPGYRVGLISAVFRQSTILSDAYDTFWTSEGLQTTTQKFYDSVEEGVTKTQSLESQNTILSKWKNPERACRSIKTTKGFEFGGTTDHEILVLDEELNLVFKELQDITEDDNIAIKKGFNYFGNDDSMPTFDDFKIKTNAKDCKIPKKLTPDLAYWMGLLIGDGCLCVGKKYGKYCAVFINEDQDLLDSFENHLIEYFVDGHESSIDRRNIKNNTWQIQYSGKKLTYYLLKCGFTKTTALDKKIPWVIKKASQGCIKGFLIGIVDTDGCVRVQLQKNGSKHCEVSFSTSSLQLAKEVQACFLNFGIMSNLGVSNKVGDRCLIGRTQKSKCAEAYKVVITGIPNLNKFRDEIGFRCERKVNKLNDYLNSIGDKVIKADVVPNASNRVLSLCNECKDQIIRICWHKDILILRKIKHCTYNRDNITKNKIKKALSLAEKYNVLTEDYYRLKKIIDLDLSFVKMTDSKYFFAPTIDVEVENESCYWSNGMISHNSKMIFSEVEKLYAQSSLFKEACEKRPIRGTDTCYVKFKSVAGKAPAFIEALPLGTDGSKIRGSRFYLLLIDELAQISTQTIDLVLRPMGAVALAPMERVRRLEQKKRLISLGIAAEEDFEDESVNKMILTSSGYYKFNHMWKRMKDHWSQIELAEKKGVESQYAVWQIPYWDLPEGFLDQNNIDEARRVMSSAEFKIEYEAEMISDSEGFFKASLLDSCTDGSNYSIELKGKAVDQYIIGVDPNQGGNASCGIVIIKIGSIKHVVNVMELKRLPTQTLTEILQKICDDYNIVRIFMDSRGGGNALRDLLEEGYGGVEPIIDITNPEHNHVEGRHILDMVDFNPKWISNANFTTKALLENKKLLFPEPPQTISDIEGRLYDNINKLKSQMLSIVVTQTGAGNLHFDTPKKNQNKDIYSAMILAAYGAREMEKEFEEDVTILHNSSGLIRERRPGATFNEITKEGPAYGKSGISFAVLKGKRRIK